MADITTISLETDEDTLSFLHSFLEFGPNRAYILSAMARPKENDSISHGSIPMFREIITDEDGIRRKYSRLKAISDAYEPEEGGDLDFRLYLTPNARDVEKSFHIFQKNLVDMHTDITRGHEGSREKIKRLDKKWESILQTDGNKDDNYFIIDLDDESTDMFNRACESLDEHTSLLFATETPNGFHIITEPFNFNNWEGMKWDDDILNTDGLTFLRML